MEAYHREDDAVILILGCLVMVLIWAWHEILFNILEWGLTLTAPFLLLLIIYKHVRRQKHNDGLFPEKWDTMDGRSFERQIVIWLRRTYENVSLTEYFDSGIDILAAKDGVVFGVQVKRSSKKVGVAAVRSAVAGLKHYGCARAMVVTNNEFTNAAIRLAAENGCLLVDGEALKRNLYSVSSKPLARI